MRYDYHGWCLGDARPDGSLANLLALIMFNKIMNLL